MFTALMLVLGGVLIAQDAPPTPIRWSAQKPAESVVAGKVVTVQVSAVIDEGWHLYALDPIEGGPIPTRIGVGPAATFTLRDKEIDKPEPKRSHDPNFGIETAYYEESATFGLPVATAASLAPGERELEITARFQACNDQICLRPQTATMKVGVLIKK
jgi:thiol:disulfide interchange protein DsbD